MISLQDYIDALMQCQEHYVQLSVRQSRLLIDNWGDAVHALYVLEDEKDTIYPNTGATLPALTDGSKRLWYRTSWEEFNSPQKKKERLIKQMLQEHLKS